MGDLVKFPGGERVGGDSDAIEKLINESTNDVIFMGYNEDGHPFTSTTMDITDAIKLINECREMLMHFEGIEE